MKLRNKKTGEIVDLIEGELSDSCRGDYIEIKPIAISCQEGYLYRSLAELNEEWEDYITTEPIIKGKKIRELVRVWAKLYGYEYEPIRIFKHNKYISLYKDAVSGYSSSVGIDLPCETLRNVKNNNYYTLTELCGD